MRSRYYYSLIVLLLAAGTVCSAQNVIVKHNDPHIHFTGRVRMQDDAAEIWWPSTSLKLYFKGTSVKITLQDEHGENYFNIIVDDKPASVLHVDSVQTEYTLASGLPDTNHSVELFKRTGWASGRTLFYQFSLDKNARLLLPPPAKKRKMEFFGNSITCGVGAEDPSGDKNNEVKYANSYLSYAALTARHFDAEFHNTSLSGIGLMVSWFPLTMPEMYNRLDPNDAESLWDFKKFVPDVVVVNVFQNDSWIVKLPDNEQFKAKFGNKAPSDDQIIKAYRNFVKTIRNIYPKSYIICALGSMDAVKPGSPWPGYIEKAVSDLNDKKILTHFFTYKNTPAHPTVQEHQAMANELIAFIDKNVSW